VQAGEGDPIVRRAATRPLHRPDLIAWARPLHRLRPDRMGEADKLPDSGAGSYRFVEHRRYFDALLEALDVHSDHRGRPYWGVTLGFERANRHGESVKGITSIVQPQTCHWKREPVGDLPGLQALRSEAGETRSQIALGCRNCSHLRR
jgi:haloalkane dehalogenase